MKPKQVFGKQMKLPDCKRCRRCGECCTGSFIDIYLVDLLREPRLLPYVMAWDSDEQEHGALGPRYNLKKEYPCPFVVKDADGLYSCSIYETRPTVCVAFLPGHAPLCSLYEDEEAREDFLLELDEEREEELEAAREGRRKWRLSQRKGNSG